jgi:hypothetical protein
MGRAPTWISSECSATSLGMPGMSEGLHTNTSASLLGALLAGVVAGVDEHCFLFGIELGADPNMLAGVVAGVERDGLNRLRWFEVAGVALRIRHLLGEELLVDDEGLGLGEGLSVLHTLHVAFVRVSVHGSDGDDPVGAQHLELEVGVVGDDHELGVARSP